MEDDEAELTLSKVEEEMTDWRTHYEQMPQDSEEIKSSLTETNLEHLLQEFRSLQDTLAEIKERYRQGSGGVTELTKTLAQITEELESAKAQIDERGTNMTDAGPLVRIKQASTRLKQEVQQMDVRIGVVFQYAITRTMWQP
ncbi:intraflagellar transport protein 57 homolog [Acropora muricata]|uniref:intraflagellar transport protein 57 homolog n=1 Tax=Acropora muricata TaxID=159855 RepID=UPI0034E42D34